MGPAIYGPVATYNIKRHRIDFTGDQASLWLHTKNGPPG